MIDISILPSNVLVALATGRKELARPTLVKLVQAEPHNVLHWLCLAVVLPRAQAILALQRALHLQPDHEPALRHLVRLREAPVGEISLELGDLGLIAEPEAEEAPLLFENEQPTFQLPRRSISPELAGLTEARFGDETATMPQAFRELLSFPGYGKTEAVSLSAILAEPAPFQSSVKVNDRTTSRSSVKVDDRPSLQNSTMLEERPTPRNNKRVEERPLFANVPASLTPSYQRMSPLQPSISRKPLITNSLNAAPPRPKPAAFVGPELAPPVETTFLNSSADSGGATGWPSYQTVPAKPALPPRMPKLNLGPRPQLGASPEPLFGFTGFGLLIMLVLLVVAVLFVVMAISR